MGWDNFPVRFLFVCLLVLFFKFVKMDGRNQDLVSWTHNISLQVWDLHTFLYQGTIFHHTPYTMLKTRLSSPNEFHTQGKINKIHSSSGPVSSVFLAQLLTLLFFWASWKEQVCYVTCPEKPAVKNYVQRTSKHELTLVPQQKAHYCWGSLQLSIWGPLC